MINRAMSKGISLGCLFVIKLDNMMKEVVFY